MRESFRTSDIFARLGGDEFAAPLTHSGADRIRAQARRFEASLKSRYTSTGLPYFIEFSYGLVAYDPRKHDSTEDMLGEADGALYENNKEQAESAVNFFARQLAHQSWGRCRYPGLYVE